MPSVKKRVSFCWNGIRELLIKNEFQIPAHLHNLSNVDCTKFLLRLFGYKKDLEKSEIPSKKKLKTEQKCALILKQENQPFISSQCIELDIKSAYPTVGANLKDEIVHADKGAEIVRLICSQFVELRKSAHDAKNYELENEHKLNSCMFIGCLENILPHVRKLITETIYDYMKQLTDYIETYRNVEFQTFEISYSILRVWTDSVIFTVSNESKLKGILHVSKQDIQRFIDHGSTINKNIVIKVDKDAHCMWLNSSIEVSFLRNGNVHQRGIPRAISKHKNSAVVLLLESLIMKNLRDLCAAADSEAIESQWGLGVINSDLFNVDIEEIIGLLTQEVNIFSPNVLKDLHCIVAKIFKTKITFAPKKNTISRCIMCNLPLSLNKHTQCLQFCKFDLD